MLMKKGVNVVICNIFVFIIFIFCSCTCIIATEVTK